MEEEEEEEDKKRERKSTFAVGTKYKAPVPNKYPKIVYLGALFAGRAIQSGRLIATTLLISWYVILSKP